MFVHINPDSRLGKVILVIGVPLFAAMLVYQIMNLARAFLSYRWPIAAGVVEESVVEKRKNKYGFSHSTAKIRYRYVAAGRSLENDTISFGVFRGMCTWGYANATVGRFPNGSAVSVRYKPSDPEVACLEPGGLGWEDGFMLLVGVAGIFFGVKELRKAIRGKAPDKTLQQTQPRT